MKDKVARRRWSTLLTVTALLAVIVVLNVAASRGTWRWDLTSAGEYTLSPATRETLAGLKTDVDLIGFVRNGPSANTPVAQILKSYEAAAAPHLRVQLVDPVSQPSLANEYGVTGYDTVAVAAGGNRQVISAANIYGGGTSVEFRAEQQITRALQQVLGRSAATVYFLTGHGEGDPTTDYSSVSSYLEGEGYKTNLLSLARTPTVPSDASVLVVGGPARDITKAEEAQIKEYLARGGRLFVLLDPSVPGTPQTEKPALEELLASFGVGVRNDMVVDPSRGSYLDPFTPVPVIRWHPATQDVVQRGLDVVLPRARSLLSEAGATGGRYKVEELLVTSDQAWGETNLNAPSAAPDAADARGTLALAVAVTDSQGGAPRAVVIGSAAFASDGAAQSAGNTDFFADMVNWLSGVQGAPLVPAKTLSQRPIQLTQGDVRQLFYGVMAGLPLLALFLAAFTWWRRRSL